MLDSSRPMPEKAQVAASKDGGAGRPRTPDRATLVVTGKDRVTWLNGCSRATS